MKAVDLFSGVGGLSCGFKKAGFQIVLAIENDPEIAMAYRKNHPDTEVIIDDIKNIGKDTLLRTIKNPDLVMGGLPCQGFSQKGKRQNLFDGRNFLFKYFIEAIKAWKPRFFLIENVPNITTTSKSYFKKRIIEEFNKLGYEVIVKTLNSYDFGIPQMRKRAFFLGELRKMTLNFPKPAKDRVSVKDAIYDLPFINSGEGEYFYKYKKPAESKYQKELRNGSNGVYNHIATNHSELSLKKLSLIPKGEGKEVLPSELLTKSIYSGTWSRLVEDLPAATITTRFDTPSSGLA